MTDAPRVSACEIKAPETAQKMPRAKRARRPGPRHIAVNGPAQAACGAPIVMTGFAWDSFADTRCRALPPWDPNR